MTLTTTGLNEYRNAMSSGDGYQTAYIGRPTYIQVGSYPLTTSSMVGSTTMLGAYYNQAFSSNTVESVTNVYETLIPCTSANGTMRSTSLHNLSTSGDMYSLHSISPEITKTGSMEVQFDFRITYSEVT